MKRTEHLRRSFWERHLDLWAEEYHIPYNRRPDFKDQIFDLIDAPILLSDAEIAVDRFASRFL